MIHDYPELIAEAARRSKSKDAASRAALFVGLAENMLSKRLRLSDMLTDAELTTDSSGMVSLPTDYQEMHVLTVNGCEIEKQPLSQILTGTANGYAVQAKTLKSSFRSTPHQAVYFGAVPSLEANNTTWLLDQEPELYLQAVIFQIKTDAEDLEGAQATASYLSGLIEDANDADYAKRLSGTRVNLGNVTP